MSDRSSEALQGRDLAMSRSCTACHGDRGEGAVGPAWIGLAGSDVELADGSTVVADADYLRRSIPDPEAQVVTGFTISMPTTKLTDPEVSALIAYEIITGDVQSFVPGAHALRTGDEDELRVAADELGADYAVTMTDDGDYEVIHTAHLFVIDDAGHLPVTWAFGTEPETIAQDLQILLGAQ